MASGAPDQPPTARSGQGRLFTWLLAATFVVVVVLAALVAYGLLSRRGPEIQQSAAPPRPETGAVAGLFVEPDDGRAPILEELEAAQESISLIVYLLSDEEIITALEAAAARGIDVRVMLEEHPYGGAGRQPEVFERLQRAGIDIRWSDPAFRFSHIKTFIIDDAVAIIMNLNLALSPFTKNREFGVVTTRPEDVVQAVAIFETDWERTGASPSGPLIVSPTNSRSELLALINRAETSLDIYAEVVRDDEMLAAIADAASRGVEVRLVMSGGANDSNARDRARLAAAGVQVHLLSELYIHAKMFLVDQAELFIGSQNLTATSLDQNRELGIILDDPGSIERASRIFERDFNAAPPESQQ